MTSDPTPMSDVKELDEILAKAIVTGTVEDWNNSHTFTEAKASILSWVESEIIGEDEQQYTVSKPYKVNPKRNTLGASTVTTRRLNEGYTDRNKLRAEQRLMLAKLKGRNHE